MDLQIHIVGKGGHELLGYADLVAHTWGGKNAKRLRRTRWQGHCLLQPTDEDLSRLALWLDNEQSPPPEDWLALMAGVDVLPVESFLGRYLQRLGHAVRKDLNLWKSLLAEVQRQLTLKTYSLQGLVPALGWLRINPPAGSPLPPLLELKLRSANLASLNHQGAVNSTEALALLEQGEELLDESATDVASAWLRVLVSATNRFDFAQGQSIADRLAALPVQSVGLVNAGKIQSSLGQLLAFRGQPAQAVERFDEALGLFARLSDPDERRRESAQTGVYRHIALQDDPSVGDFQPSCPNDRF
ncbi:hypothetical protein C9974_12180 [Marinobacter sp. B9-2]|nr:hypothetical protein C9974_12180 [Marinobacter sp. B9-2]